MLLHIIHWHQEILNNYPIPNIYSTYIKANKHWKWKRCQIFDKTAFIETLVKVKRNNCFLMHIGPHTYTQCKIWKVESILLFYKLSKAYLWLGLNVWKNSNKKLRIFPYCWFNITKNERKFTNQRKLKI